MSAADDWLSGEQPTTSSESLVRDGRRPGSLCRQGRVDGRFNDQRMAYAGDKEANPDAKARRENKNSRVVSNVVVVSKAEPRSLAAQISGQGCFFGNKKSRGFRFGTTLERTGQKGCQNPDKAGWSRK